MNRKDYQLLEVVFIIFLIIVLSPFAWLAVQIDRLRERYGDGE